MEILAKENISTNPIDQFRQWFEEAMKCEAIAMAEAMCLSTVSEDGFPEGRMVLLKGDYSDGFVFYTNMNSPKAKSLYKNSKAEMTFYWNPLGRQIRIQGTVQVISDQEADAYFLSRPRFNQIGAWASDQSAVLDNRVILDEKFEEYDEKFKDREVPRPPHWSGFRLTPIRLEFWQEGNNRLHDRFVYIKTSAKEWVIQRLNP